jgi:hypothetical protein
VHKEQAVRNLPWMGEAMNYRDALRHLLDLVNKCGWTNDVCKHACTEVSMQVRQVSESRTERPEIWHGMPSCSMSDAYRRVKIMFHTEQQVFVYARNSGLACCCSMSAYDRIMCTS